MKKRVQAGYIGKAVKLSGDFNVINLKVHNNGNYVRLWDELVCLINSASRFIYLVLQMLASSFMVFGS